MALPRFLTTPWTLPGRIFYAVCFLVLVGSIISIDVTQYNHQKGEIAALREENAHLAESVEILHVSADLAFAELEEKVEEDADDFTKLIQSLGGIHEQSVKSYVAIERIEETIPLMEDRLGFLEVAHWELENIVHCMDPNTTATDEECVDYRLPDGEIAAFRDWRYR